MTDTPSQPGQNTVARERLRSIVERIENINARIKEEQEARTAIYAEAKANGFSGRAIRHVVKMRQVKPDDRKEWEEERDMYMFATGMGSDAPPHAGIALSGVDKIAREQMIEMMEPLVPINGKGSIEVRLAEGKGVRLLRDKDGKVYAEDIIDVAPDAPSSTQIKPVKPREPVPDCDAEGAKQIGRDYRKANRPIVDNPFPFGDSRRIDFENGWCAEDGGDGMGPRED